VIGLQDSWSLTHSTARNLADRLRGLRRISAAHALANRCPTVPDPNKIGRKKGRACDSLEGEPASVPPVEDRRRDSGRDASPQSLTLRCCQCQWVTEASAPPQSAANARFTRRSSREWKVRTAKRPPGQSRAGAAASKTNLEIARLIGGKPGRVFYLSKEVEPMSVDNLVFSLQRLKNWAIALKIGKYFNIKMLCLKF
jgi:hypothetical protein